MSVEVLEKDMVFVIVAAADGEMMKHEQAEDTELGFPFAAERYVGIGFGASRLNLDGAVTYDQLRKFKSVVLWSTYRCTGSWAADIIEHVWRGRIDGDEVDNYRIMVNRCTQNSQLD